LCDFFDYVQTNINLSAGKTALKYKELWQVEHAFLDLESILKTRPTRHQWDNPKYSHH
jgi:hypothetical protein